MTPAWWVAPVTQDDLEQDFINTYKFRNLTFYGKLLDDGFTFIPSSVDTSKFKNVYKNWNSETENKVTELIFQTYSSRINVELKNIRDEVDLPDSIRIFRSYSLEAKGWNVSGDSLKVFQGAGEMVLTLVPDPDTGTELLIKAWRDVRTTDLTETWGVLKLSIRQELP